VLLIEVFDAHVTPSSLLADNQPKFANHMKSEVDFPGSAGGRKFSTLMSHPPVYWLTTSLNLQITWNPR